MRDTRDILLDNRPGIQLVGYVMTGGADQLDAALERGMLMMRRGYRATNSGESTCM